MADSDSDGLVLGGSAASSAEAAEDPVAPSSGAVAAEAGPSRAAASGARRGPKTRAAPRSGVFHAWLVADRALPSPTCVVGEVPSAFPALALVGLATMHWGVPGRRRRLDGRVLSLGGRRPNLHGYTRWHVGFSQLYN